jgi:hypothetical protein
MNPGSPRSPEPFTDMYVVTEADAAAIREVYERDGELSAAIELRRRFPGITDNATAREQARRIPAGRRCHHAQHGAVDGRLMPIRGSLTLADVAAKTDVLAVSCRRCDRAGRYPLATL